MLKYGIILGILSSVLSVIAISLFGSMSVSIPIGLGGLSGMLMVYWFPYAKKRKPTKKEHISIASTYGLFMAAAIFMPIFLAKTPTTAGVLTLIVYALAYPSFFTLIFNDKYISERLKKISSS
jgi:hypothetical protein